MNDEDLAGTQTECSECLVVGRHKVTDSRPLGKPSNRTHRRRKECPSCGHRYTTYEIPAERYLETEELAKWRDLFGDIKTAEEVYLLIQRASQIITLKGGECTTATKGTTANSDDAPLHGE